MARAPVVEGRFHPTPASAVCASARAMPPDAGPVRSGAGRTRPSRCDAADGRRFDRGDRVGDAAR